MKKSYQIIKLSSIFIGCLLAFNALVFASEKTPTDGFTLPYYNSAEFTPHWLSKNNQELSAFHKISEFSLTNQLGQTITKANLKGKVYIANFFFSTCPGICPKIRSNLFKVQNKFIDNDQVVIISHSIQPENDTVKVLQEYAQDNKVVANKWHLLTGDRDDIYKLAREDYFANEDLGKYKDNEDFLHTENLILVDKQGHIRGIYNGLNKTSVGHLLNDINTLLSPN
jgi:protein SCO1/2